MNTEHVTHNPWQPLLVCICKELKRDNSQLSTRFGEDPTMQVNPDTCQ